LSERRLRLALKPSPPLAAVVLILHGMAGACMIVSLPGVPGALLAAALGSLGALAAWNRALLRAASSIRAIELHGAEAIIHLAGGASFPADIGERRYVSRFFVALPLRRPMRRTILVTRDMLSEDSFRKLRVWALWRRLPAVAAKQLPA
jgi:hypothetical protein